MRILVPFIFYCLGLVVGRHMCFQLLKEHLFLLDEALFVWRSLKCT